MFSFDQRVMLAFDICVLSFLSWAAIFLDFFRIGVRMRRFCFFVSFLVLRYCNKKRSMSVFGRRLRAE